MDAQTTIAALLAKLSDEIGDVDEETFTVFSQPIPSQDLGMVNAKAHTLSISVCGRDFEISQSPGILQSNRAGGTTGAAVWRTSVVFAEWMGWSRNPLFTEGVLDEDSIALELGAGISGILPCLLGSKIKRMIGTDQTYVLKTLQENINSNTASGKRRSGTSHQSKSQSRQFNPSNAEVFSLDWENDEIARTMSINGLGDGIDVLLACDCIFNYALINPLVQTCVELCKLRWNNQEADRKTTVCVVAQQLRQPEVFDEWLRAFHQHFRIWRVPDNALTDELKEGSGFVIHVGILREHRQQ